MTRQECAATVLGGPTTVLDVGGLRIDAVVLHAGAARVPARFRNRALSLDSVRAAAAAAILGPAKIIPAHYDGWTHFGHLGEEPGLAARPSRCRTIAMASSSASVQAGAWINPA